MDGTNGGIAALDLRDDSDNQEPIFNIEKVQLQFSLSADFVAAQVANNVLVLALATGRIMRIDLDNAADIEDIDLPKKSSEVGLIRRMFLDPSASHLIINTTQADNFYLHTQSKTPKTLARLKGVAIESIAWNPALPTASTREILVGAADGNVYETYIESQSEFLRREEKYLTNVFRVSNGSVTGLSTSFIDPKIPDARRILISSHGSLLHFAGRLGRNRHGDGLYGKIFDSEPPTVQEAPEGTRPSASMLAFSPDMPAAELAGQSSEEKIFAWLYGEGLLHGGLVNSTDLGTLGAKTFSLARNLSKTRIPRSETAAGRKKASQEAITAVCLTQWHIVCLIEGRVVAINRLDEKIVYDQTVLEPGETALGLFADQRKNTFWLFTPQEIFEIAVTNEDRDVWKIMLKEQNFEAALQYAQGDAQKDAVAKASGDYLISRKKYMEAALVYGKSSKPFEEVSLTFIDHNEQDALRKYLLTKIGNYKKDKIMQRMLIASWLIEVFMSKMNSLDDTITTRAELAENTTAAESESELSSVRKEYHDFVNRYKDNLDKKTTYDIVSSHGRERELLTYATAIDDSDFILSYWIQRERWRDALDVLKRQTDPEIFYRHATVLIQHEPMQFIDILMRHSDINPRKIIPALLAYNQTPAEGAPSQNQAARYLNYCIDTLGSTDAAVHNTLISIYAAQPGSSEAELMRYLTLQSSHPPPRYDADFALRLCIQHARVESCVHLYSLMGQYGAAVTLALKHNKTDLAALVADRPAETNPSLRKTLWLSVAKKVLGEQGNASIRTALEFLKRCDLLRIEDLIPFFPDFVVIDDFREEICEALEGYSRHIDALKAEMDESAATAANIQADIKALDKRYAVVQPGEACRVCGLPLLSRQFFVFPSCQHGFHSDCLGRKVLDGSGLTTRSRIRELQTAIGKAVHGPKRERDVRELDALVGRECILCSEYAIRLIEEPFVRDGDAEGQKDWAI